ncbi:MAG: hypothetical protein ACHQF2_07625 [Flavobacteriales bacterium]
MQQSELNHNGNFELEKRIGSIASDWFKNQEQNGVDKSYVTWKKGSTIFLKPNYVAPLGGPIVHSFITTKNQKTHLTTSASLVGKIYAVVLVMAYVAATTYMFFRYAGTPEFSISMLVMALFGIVMVVGIVIATVISTRSQHDHLKHALGRDQQG